MPRPSTALAPLIPSAAGVLKKLLRVLHADGILTEDLGQPHDMSALEAKYMGICRRDATSKRRRIDILTIPFEQWGGALIYFTVRPSSEHIVSAADALDQGDDIVRIARALCTCH